MQNGKLVPDTYYILHEYGCFAVKVQGSYLSEGGGARSHKNLSHSVVEPLHGLIIYTQETLCCPFLCYLKTNIQLSTILSDVPTVILQIVCNSTYLILQIPNTIFVRKLLITSAALREDATLKATHIEKQVGVVLAVHRHKAVLPLNCRHRTRESILDVPEHSTAPVRL